MKTVKNGSVDGDIMGLVKNVEGDAMNALPIRDQLIQELDKLSDEQIVTVLEFIHSVTDDVNLEEVSIDDDPLVGFISGPTDAAENTKAILRAEFGKSKSRDHEQE